LKISAHVFKAFFQLPSPRQTRNAIFSTVGQRQSAENIFSFFQHEFKFLHKNLLLYEFTQYSNIRKMGL